MVYSLERDLCDFRFNFFKTIHFKLLKIRKLVGKSASDTKKTF